MPRLTVLLLAASLLGVGATPAAAAPSPIPTDELLSGMVTEQVEPHVVRVIDDGAGHDLTDLDTFEDRKPASLLSVGSDGSVWLTSSGGFIRIGTPGEIPDPLGTFLAQMEIGPDGMLAIADGHHGAAIARLRSGSWAIHELPSTAWVVWLEATPDGGLRFAWRDASLLTFGALPESDGDQPIASSPPPLELGSPDGQIAVARTPDGLVWVAESLWWEAVRTAAGHIEGEGRRAPGRLWVFDGTSWREAKPLGDDARAQPNEMVVDGAGSLWIRWLEVVEGKLAFGSSGYLTRRDDDGTWSIFSDVDSGFTGGLLLADGDGVWLAPGWCEGYARFDGEQLTRYLDGLCVRPPGISPAGDIWLFGHRRDREDAGVYVITP